MLCAESLTNDWFAWWEGLILLCDCCWSEAANGWNDWNVAFNAFRLKFHFAASKLRSQLICLHNLRCEIKCEIRIDQPCLLFNGIKKNRNHIIHLVTQIWLAKDNRVISNDFDWLQILDKFLWDRLRSFVIAQICLLREFLDLCDRTPESGQVLRVHAGCHLSQLGSGFQGSQRSSNLWNVGSWFRKADCCKITELKDTKGDG